ncbi:hypothetical protein D3C72_1443440 [compost metagenome]
MLDFFGVLLSFAPHALAGTGVVLHSLVGLAVPAADRKVVLLALGSRLGCHGGLRLGGGLHLLGHGLFSLRAMDVRHPQTARMGLQ